MDGKSFYPKNDFDKLVDILGVGFLVYFKMAVFYFAQLFSYLGGLEEASMLSLC